MARKRRKKRITVGFVALGCPKNIVDSERMLAQIALSGFIITADIDNADVLVINTCAFIEPAKAEALQAINHAVKQKRKAKIKKIVVAGCLPQRQGTKLFAEADGIDAIVGLEQRDNIAQLIKKTLAADEPVTAVTPAPAIIHDDRTRLRITPQHYAYLRISEGCSRNCSFCTIPSIRGPFRSKPQELIISEAKELVASGAIELNIIAQDTTNYGRDLNVKNALPMLLSELEKIPDLEWLRLLYLYPTGINDRLIETIAGSEKIVHYLDIPIQHIDNRLLKAMNRPGTKDQITALLEKLRSKIPDAVLRTTVIVGFPGETDEQFAELLEFVKSAQFDHLGCFIFYPELGTPAAQMPNQIPENVKQARRERLMLTQQQIAFDKNIARIGSELTCLLDSIDNNSTATARFYGQAPDIDSVCIIENLRRPPGRFTNAKVIGTKNYDLICKQKT